MHTANSQLIPTAQHGDTCGACGYVFAEGEPVHPAMECTEKLKPCVRCLSEQIRRQRAGLLRQFCILQCEGCDFNVTALTWEVAVKLWNGFKVWELVGK